MSNTSDEGRLELLHQRLCTLLPEQYEAYREEIAPTPMRSANLKFRSDGSVAWDEMWASFCHLAMAGGPPHKGTLLEPGSREAIAEQPGKYRQVLEEVCRGIALVTTLEVAPSRAPGWVRVECTSAAMAHWLLRAITIENVSVRGRGSVVELPAGPDYRLEKEIKNVITVIAKTCHYWRDHMTAAKREAIANVLQVMDRESNLIEPAFGPAGPRDRQERAHGDMNAAFEKVTGVTTTASRYDGWFGIDLHRVSTAVWMLRMMMASNVLSRREGTALYVPVNQSSDPGGRRVLEIFTRVYDLALSEGVASGRQELSC